MDVPAHKAGSALIAVFSLAYGELINANPLIVSAFALWGGLAPDFLEYPVRVFGRRFSLIPHRTITHWWLPWVSLVFVSILLLTQKPDEMLTYFASSAILGFSLGALSHLALDGLTPMGVAIWHPLRPRRLSKRARKIIKISIACVVITTLLRLISIS